MNIFLTEAIKDNKNISCPIRNIKIIQKHELNVLIIVIKIT